MSMSARPVAIIGAGWSGLQIATVLRDCGHDVRLFEQLDDVGGTWHPANAYAGPRDPHARRFAASSMTSMVGATRTGCLRLPAPDVFDNCRAFADAKGLRPLIAFGIACSRFATTARAA